MFCPLCVSVGCGFKSLYDANGQGNWLHLIMLEYFHPKIVNMEKGQRLSVICLKCFEHISDFHNFQKSIMEAQQKLRDMEKPASSISTEVDQATMDDLPSGQALMDPLSIKVEEATYVDAGDCQYTWQEVEQPEEAIPECSTLQNIEQRAGRKAAEVLEDPAVANDTDSVVASVVKNEMDEGVKSLPGTLSSQYEEDITPTENNFEKVTGDTNTPTSAQNKDKRSSHCQIERPPNETHWQSDCHETACDDYNLNCSNAQSSHWEQQEIKYGPPSPDIGPHFSGVSPIEDGPYSSPLEDLDDEDIKTHIILPDLDITDVYSPSDEDCSEDDYLPTFQCTLCDQNYASRSDLRSHKIAQHPESHQRMSCQLCDKQFNLVKGLELHNTLCHKIRPATKLRLQAAYCPNILSDLTLAESRPETNNHHKYACKLCGKEFNLEKGLELHYTLFHRTESGIQANARTLRYERAENTDLEEDAEMLLTRPKLEIMDVDSDTDLSSNENLPFTKSKGCHTENAPKFFCQLCAKCFNFKKGLELHNILSHKNAAQSQQPASSNESCSSMASSFSGQTHLGTVMTRRQPKYACKLCNKVYNLEKGLALHYTLVHGRAQAISFTRQQSDQIEMSKRPRRDGENLKDPEHCKYSIKTVI